jgi:hypothetical protein
MKRQVSAQDRIEYVLVFFEALATKLTGINREEIGHISTANERTLWSEDASRDLRLELSKTLPPRADRALLVLDDSVSLEEDYMGRVRIDLKEPPLAWIPRLVRRRAMSIAAGLEPTRQLKGMSQKVLM